MIYTRFENYEQFKAEFGTPKNRKNKMLLNLYRDALHSGEARKKIFNTINKYTNLDDVKNDFLSNIFGCGVYPLEGFGNFRSDKYATDHMKGVCIDGSIGHIRYRNIERDKIFKMKAGKFFTEIVKADERFKWLSDATIIMLSEEFTQRWQAISQRNQPEGYELRVNDDFKEIYSSENRYGDFHSCMTDQMNHTFYKDAVNASAASIWKDGTMYARCVIFNEVTIDSGEHKGEVVRLAERQYATDNIYRQILIDMLIADKRIDGYKTIGAGCGDNKAFVWNNGESLRENMHIECKLEDEDIISYQDSFKYFGYDAQIAYNTDCCDCFELTETGYKARYSSTEDEIYSDYYDEYFEEDNTVWSEYHNSYLPEYYDDVVYSDRRNTYLVASDNDVCYNETTREYDVRDYCNYCEDDDCWYSDDDENIVYCEDDELYHKRRFCTLCEDDRNWYYDDDDEIHYCEDTECYHLDQNCRYCDENGKYYRDPDLLMVDADGNTILAETAVEINGEWFSPANAERLSAELAVA